MKFIKRKMNQKRGIALVMVFALLASLVPTKAVGAEGTGNVPQKAKCTMTIESDKHTLQNPARPTYPCTELIKGFYVKETGQFNILGMVAHPVEYSGQQFEIGIPYDGYTTAILTVYTVKKDVSKNTGKVAAGGGRNQSKPSTKQTPKSYSKPVPKPSKQQTGSHPRQSTQQIETSDQERNEQNDQKIEIKENIEKETNKQVAEAKEQENEPQEVKKALSDYEDILSLIEKYSQEEATFDIAQDLKGLVDYGFKKKEIPLEDVQKLTRNTKRWREIKGFFELERIKEINDLQNVKVQLEKLEEKIKKDKKENGATKKDEPKGFVEIIIGFVQSIVKFFKELF
jgi:hypothetical protein